MYVCVCGYKLVYVHSLCSTVASIYIRTYVYTLHAYVILQSSSTLLVLCVCMCLYVRVCTYVRYVRIYIHTYSETCSLCGLYTQVVLM